MLQRCNSVKVLLRRRSQKVMIFLESCVRILDPAALVAEIMKLSLWKIVKRNDKNNRLEACHVNFMKLLPQRA